ncbi:MAG: asparagine synthase (glutamine-hydrolyzing) [Bacteroidia bacterium]|nr:asparagine synthase (glutamine-hydrolyzing) [Bacteroidia bacterium]
MCGIAAILCRDTRLYVREILAMTRSLAHRGPDDSGFIIATPQNLIPAGDESSKVTLPNILSLENQSGTAFLGHRKLAILDKSPQNHQPFLDSSGNYALIFNGEIYNFKELRHSLKQKGIFFKTQGDTEVLLHWLIQYGAEGISSLNGMFAFIFWDNIRQNAIAARDIVGMKPLYLGYEKNFSCLASEYKAFFASKLWDLQINESAVAEYLWRGKTAQSFYTNIEEIPAGSFIEFTNGIAKPAQKYRKVLINNNFEIPTRAKTQQYADEIRDKVIQANLAHQVADVPIGLALSGGIDSSCLWAASRQKPTFCFTVSWPNWNKDERHFAENITQQSDCRHIFINPTQEQFLLDLPDFIRAQEVPTGSLSVYAQFCLMRAANTAQVPVLIDGQGGDELFAGYHRFYIPWMAEYIHNKPSHFARELFQQRSFSWVFEYLSTYAEPYKSIIKSLHPLAQWILLPYSQRKSNRFFSLNTALFDSLQVSSLPTLLRYADRNAMWFSIESRSPFADDIPLISYLFQVPGMFKIQHFTAKILLKHAFQKELPQQILMRTDKIGFEAPINIWMRQLPFPNHNFHYSQKWLNISNLEKEWELIKRKTPAALLWRILSVLYWEKYVLSNYGANFQT